MLVQNIFMNWQNQGGKNIFIKSKSLNFTKKQDIYIYMGRPKKEEKDKKIKVGICLDRNLYTELMKDGGRISQIIEKIIKEHFGNKNL